MRGRVPYRLTHGQALSEGEAAHLLARAAHGEALTHAPVKRRHAWALAHLATLTPGERAQHDVRVRGAAAVLAGLSVPAALGAQTPSAAPSQGARTLNPRGHHEKDSQ